MKSRKKSIRKCCWKFATSWQTLLEVITCKVIRKGSSATPKSCTIEFCKIIFSEDCFCIPFSFHSYFYMGSTCCVGTPGVWFQCEQTVVAEIRAAFILYRGEKKRLEQEVVLQLPSLSVLLHSAILFAALSQHTPLSWLVAPTPLHPIICNHYVDFRTSLSSLVTVGPVATLTAALTLCCLGNHEQGSRASVSLSASSSLLACHHPTLCEYITFIGRSLNWIKT